MKQLNEIQHQVIIGSLLGDGSLQKGIRSKNPLLFITRQIRDREYLQWEYNVFRDLSSPKGMYEIKYFDKRTNKTYHAIRFRTRNSEPLASYYDEWYPCGIKIIPKTLQLTPLSVAVWIADDGCVNCNVDRNKSSKFYGKKYPNTLKMKLSTHGFSDVDLKILLDQLKKFSGRTDFHIYADNGKKFIVCFSETTKTILRLIDDVFPCGMNRKQDIWRNVI